MAAVLVPPGLLTGCGGGGSDSASDTSIKARAKRLLGAVVAKLEGTELGKLIADVRALSDEVSEITGTVTLDGETFTFKTTVDEENNFFAEATNTTPGDGGGSTVLSNLRITGKLLAPAGSNGPLGIEGTWMGELPKPGGLPGQTVPATGTLVADAEPSGTGDLPTAASCPWSPTAFYNAKEVVSYQGKFYTSTGPVVPFGAVGEPLFNPAVSTLNWAERGTRCAPTPFVEIATAQCTRGATEDVVVMTGTAYGGGIGDALAAYTNATDASYSNENNFGLPNLRYTMTCTGGGFDGRFQSKTTPAYSVCVKTTASDAATRWTSTQTIPHSSSSIPLSTAYISKGNPLHATVFGVGAIVLGFDAVRSAPFTMTGTCQ